MEPVTLSETVRRAVFVQRTALLYATKFLSIMKLPVAN